MNIPNSMPGLSGVFGLGTSSMLSGLQNTMSPSTGLSFGLDNAMLSSDFVEQFGSTGFSNPFGNLTNLLSGLGNSAMPGFAGSCNLSGSMFGGAMQQTQAQQQILQMLMALMQMLQMQRQNGMGANPAAAGGAGMESPGIGGAGGYGSPVGMSGATPAASGGVTPASSGGAIPASSGGATPASSGGVTPASSGGATPASSGGAIPASSGGTIPSSSFPREGGFTHNNKRSTMTSYFGWNPKGLQVEGITGKGGSIGDPVALMKQLEGLRTDKVSGLLPGYNVGSRKDKNCAQFVSSVLEATGRLEQGNTTVRGLEERLKEEGYYLVSKEDARPGDVYIKDGHTEIVASDGAATLMGSNNVEFTQDEQYITEVNNMGSFDRVGGRYYHKDFPESNTDAQAASEPKGAQAVEPTAVKSDSAAAKSDLTAKSSAPDKSESSKGDK